MIGGMMAEESAPIRLDEDQANADWTKRTWDLPDPDSAEFADWLEQAGTSLEQLKRLPVWRFREQKRSR